MWGVCLSLCCENYYMMNRPPFIFDICVARTAIEFLQGDLSLEPFAKKYADFLSDGGASVQQHSIQAPAEAMLLFLNDVEAGDSAADLLNDFTYFRLYFDGVGRPRKLKPMFGTIEDYVKTAEWNADITTKAFKAFVFALRSQTVPQAPSGWLLESETEVAPALAAIVGKKLTVLDIL